MYINSTVTLADSFAPHRLQLLPPNPSVPNPTKTGSPSASPAPAFSPTPGHRIGPSQHAGRRRRQLGVGATHLGHSKGTRHERIAQPFRAVPESPSGPRRVVLRYVRSAPAKTGEVWSSGAHVRRGTKRAYDSPKE